MKNFGRYLKKIRNGVMTQRELAKKIGVGYPYISKLENNVESTPSDEILIKIAEALKVDMDSMFICASRIPPDLREFIIEQPEALQLLRFIQQNPYLMKEFNEPIKTRENIYWKSFQKNRHCMLLIDPDTSEITNANSAAIEFYQYSFKKLRSMMITDSNVLSREEIFQEMRKARLQLRNHFNFRHRLNNGLFKEVEVHADPIIISGKTYLHSIISEK